MGKVSLVKTIMGAGRTSEPDRGTHAAVSLAKMSAGGRRCLSRRTIAAAHDSGMGGRVEARPFSCFYYSAGLLSMILQSALPMRGGGQRRVGAPFPARPLLIH